MHQTYTYLALGDSYTIGEGITLHKNFPYQTVQLLRKQNYNFFAPEIIAKTGWTTDELEEGIKENKLLPKYDFVSLLIGVNNQFRGRDVLMYKLEFEELLKKTIAFANDKKNHVIVISIPDYSVTPFLKAAEVEKISKEIDVFNNINKSLSIQYKVQYLDISKSWKETANITGHIGDDKLHPSAIAYSYWAEKLAAIIVEQLK